MSQLVSKSNATTHDPLIMTQQIEVAPMEQPHEPIEVQPWHNDDHIPARRVMIADIVARLTRRQSSAPAGWYGRLPSMCSRLEQRLYTDATSFEEYNGRGTWPARLQGLGMRIQDLELIREFDHAYVALIAQALLIDGGNQQNGNEQQELPQTIADPSNIERFEGGFDPDDIPFLIQALASNE